MKNLFILINHLETGNACRAMSKINCNTFLPRTASAVVLNRLSQGWGLSSAPL